VSTQQDGPGGGLERGVIRRGQQVSPQDEHRSMCFVTLVSQGRLTRPDQGFQRVLELLRVGLHLLVEHDQIDR
jgi:hypothetical protein